MDLFLFFTYGISLKTWAETGLLDKEIQIYKRLINKGLKVSFITYGDGCDYQFKDKLGEIEIIPFYAFVKRPKNALFRFIQSHFLPIILRDYLKRADIIKTNQMSTTFAPLIAKFLFKKKLIVRCGFEWYFFMIQQKTTLFSRIRMFITEWIYYHLTDTIILTSETAKQFVSNTFYIKKDKIKIISNFVDIDIYNQMNLYQRSNGRLLFIGRLTRQKNLFNLFDAIKQSLYYLDIIGDGELKLQLLEYAKRNQIRVNFLGKIPNSQIPELMNQYEVFILPSLYEGNPKALLEAMACGLAVIGTNVVGIKEIIKHKINGYLCNTDSESIRKAIDTVMNDKELRRQMGENARKYVLENYDLNKIIDKEYKLYQKLLC